ncbi:MAG: hypothetical protein JSR44_09415 [Spirochaetes bacterium]|nr:hypothetical protein [Spirochaetota bacterium]
MKSFKGDVVDKIPLFNEDGEAKFLLRVKNKGSYEGVPKYQAWSPHKYADLVAITTAGEAEGAANISEAGELGTRLIKWNSTGKGASFYASIGDMRCAAVDGQIASLEETGTTINGKHYPYWRTLLPGPYNTCHPNCRHRFAPILEEVVAYDNIPGNREHLVPKRDAVVVPQKIGGIERRLTLNTNSDILQADNAVETDNVQYASEREAQAGQAKLFDSETYVRSLTAQEAMSKRVYAGDGYGAINGGMRGETVITPAVRAHIANMESAIEKFELPENYIVFRGFRHVPTQNILLDAIKNSTAQIRLTDPAFLSTSFSEDVAKGFAGIDRPVFANGGMPIMLRLQAPKGTHVMGGHRGEAELIFSNRSTVIIQKITEQNGVIYCEGYIE